MLGREVARRADDRALARQLRARVGLEETRDAEVEHLHAAIAADEDVSRLQIPVHDRLLVRGSEAAAINEVHQLYVDALALSPPAPTMLDLRDAMLQADALRNPGTPVSANFCALWEPFATRGMGLDATDTKDNGFNQVSANFSVPDGCQAPPSPCGFT